MKHGAGTRCAELLELGRTTLKASPRQGGTSTWLKLSADLADERDRDVSRCLDFPRRKYFLRRCRLEGGRSANFTPSCSTSVESQPAKALLRTIPSAVKTVFSEGVSFTTAV